MKIEIRINNKIIIPNYKERELMIQITRIIKVQMDPILKKNRLKHQLVKEKIRKRKKSFIIRIQKAMAMTIMI